MPVLTLKAVTLFVALFVCSSWASAQEADALGAPLLFRKLGVVHDEYGPVFQSDGRPKMCQIEAYSHYYRIDPGMGLTLMGSPNAQKLFGLSFGNSPNNSVVLADQIGLHISAVPQIEDGRFLGREMLTGMVISQDTDLRNYLNILRFRGGELAEYEVRLLALEPTPAKNSPIKLGEGAPTLRQDLNRWTSHPNYYLYLKCIFETPVS